MPPPVLALPAPMNISTSVASQLEGYICVMSMLLKPALRGMTPVKNAASSLAGSDSGPSVLGLDHSVNRNTTVPNTISTADIASVIRVRIDHLLGRRHDRSSSNHTGKPSPPMMTATAMVTQIQGSETNLIRLSGQSANPELLNAATAWKAPR